MLYRAQKISVFCGGTQFQDLNAQKTPAGRGLTGI